MRPLAHKRPPLSGMISSNVLKRNVKEMSNEMAQQDFPRIQSEIKLGAPATTDEFEITEGRGAKK